tara:strand:+ start:2959 stop:4179 length:1221 start_codon:yes stop_codon:yes gene_type:complete
MFKKYNQIKKDEIVAVNKVLKSGILTGYQGKWSKEFFGGPKVLEFEAQLKKFYKSKNAIVFNSWTSGLIASIGSIDISPGDEIILPSFTFCAVATSVIHWNAIPIFADVNSKTFTIDPEDVKKKISNKTKAIILVDTFGHPAEVNELKKIAKKNKLILISDSCHAPYALYKNKLVGNLTDITGFSFNGNKHISTGEGGVVLTDNNLFADKMRLIRNHGEAVVKDKRQKNISNILGQNYRLGEIEAALGIEQYKKIKKLINKRIRIYNYLTEKLKKLPGIFTPEIRKNCTHNFYIYPLVINKKIIKHKRSKIVKSLEKKGMIGLWSGYFNLHMLPIFQKKIAYGKSNLPWSLSNKKISYKKGICPISEDLHDKTLIGFKAINYEISKNDVNKIFKIFKSVWKDLKIS